MCFKWNLIKICWNSLAKQLKLTMVNINHSDFQSFDCLFSSGSGWRLNLSALSKSQSLSKACKNEFEQVVLNILKFTLSADYQHQF